MFFPERSKEKRRGLSYFKMVAFFFFFFTQRHRGCSGIIVDALLENRFFFPLLSNGLKLSCCQPK